MRSSDLPAMASLRAFEAVGRLLSFRKAGEELLITQSAVSHHIRKLETELGLTLFQRNAGGAALTPAGESYLKIVQQALSQVARGTAAIRRRSQRRRIRLGLAPSIAANWLVPRLERLSRTHPDLELELVPAARDPDFARDGLDLAIAYGDGAVLGLEAIRLLPERLGPVLSPALAVRQPLLKPQDLYAHTVLLSRRSPEWHLWIAAYGLDSSQLRVRQLTDYNVVLQAAVGGIGVAMGRRLLVQDALERGTLVGPPLEPIATDTLGHWLMAPIGAYDVQEVRDMRDAVVAVARTQET